MVKNKDPCTIGKERIESSYTICVFIAGPLCFSLTNGVIFWIYRHCNNNTCKQYSLLPFVVVFLIEFSGDTKKSK